MKRKNLWKRTLAAVMSTAMLLGAATTAMAAEYSDVHPGDWYYDYVKSVGEKGLMTGYQNGNFGPHDKLTRGQFATILYRADGSPETAFEWGIYNDVAEGKFYSIPAIWGYYSKCITGYANGDFGPVDDITREQVATILYREAGKPEVNENLIWGYPDGGEVSRFARLAMAWAIDKGLIQGNGGLLSPQNKCNRAECATILERYSNLDNSGGGSGNGGTENPAPEQNNPSHEHNWVDDTTVVKWDEEVYKTELHWFCGICKVDLTNEAADKDVTLTNDYIDAHMKKHAMEEGKTGNWYQDTVKILDRTIPHERTLPAGTKHCSDCGASDNGHQHNWQKVSDDPWNQDFKCDGCGTTM